MKVAVTGVNFVNKGAQLMMRAVLDELSSWPERPQVGLPPYVGSAAQRRALGAQHYLIRYGSRLTQLSPLVKTVGDLLPGGVASRLHLMRARDADLVLDASGFAYSDQWGLRRTRFSADLYRDLRRGGARIVLLPQALGPFEDPRIAEAFQDLATSADLVFARDPISLGHARAAAPAAQNVALAPDFTVPLTPEPHPEVERFAGRACVMPNVRMMDKTSPEAAAWYLDTLRRSLERLDAWGLRPYLLLHQEDDAVVIDRLGAPWTERLERVWEPDPLRIKSLLGASSIVLGSRFHGLIGAFAEGVPPIGIGWSHKYEMLYEEYGCRDLLVPALAPFPEVEARLQRVRDPASRDALVASIRKRVQAQREETRRMWERVRAVAATARGAP